MELKRQKRILLEILKTEMPFGKYKGAKLIDLPQNYLNWFAQKGFPKGKLGMQLNLVHEIKLNGLEEIVRKIK